MLPNVGLTKDFWIVTVNTTCYFVDHSPSIAIDYRTPYEVWSGALADYSNLKTFTSPAYCHVTKGKLVPKSKKMYISYGIEPLSLQLKRTRPLRLLNCRLKLSCIFSSWKFKVRTIISTVLQNPNS